MFRHQDVADHSEFELTPQGIENNDEGTAETVGIKQACTTVGAGGDKVQMVQSVIMRLAGHTGIVP